MGTAAADAAGDALADRIAVLVVDAHASLRDAIRATFLRASDIYVAGECEDVPTAISRAKALQPAVIVVDALLPGIEGADGAASLRKALPHCAVVTLSTYQGEPQGRAANDDPTLSILKSCLRNDLIGAVRAGFQQRLHEARFAAVNDLPEIGDSLSDRELEILALVAEGHANKVVARLLSISVDTVKMHLKNIFTKLAVTDRTHAVVVAIRRGLIRV